MKISDAIANVMARAVRLSSVVGNVITPSAET